MSRTLSDVISHFQSHLERRQHFIEAVNLMEWDSRTGAPRKGAKLRAEAIGTLSDEIYQLSTAESLHEDLQFLLEPTRFAALSDKVKRLVTLEMKDLERQRKIPQDRNRAFQVLRSEAESVWEIAKENNDFASFQPYLEKVVAMRREFADYWGYEDHPYDALVDEFEPGMTVSQLDPVFSYVRNETVKLLHKIEGSSVRPDLDVLVGMFPASDQRAFSIDVLNQMGYDFTAGRLDETVHPFCNTINRYDVRLTTNFRETDLTFALFATMHEGGHGLYEQGIDPDLIGTPLATGTSLGMHESQSRFWENMVGLSKEFWLHNYSKLQHTFSHFQTVPMDQFYRAVNHVEPSFIRIEADELTYNLHIMIRYELEKGLISQSLQAKDLPELWREKMNEYLGIMPDTDSLGVLQDVHWAGGLMGYFPTYSLGNIYSAQFRHQLLKEMPDFLQQVQRGELLGIKRWFNEKVHRFGRMMDGVDLVRRVTGEDPNPRYLIDYLNEKFGALYQL